MRENRAGRDARLLPHSTVHLVLEPTHLLDAIVFIMSDPLNFGDMSTDDFLQLLTYTNSTPPVETSKPSPRQDYLGYASLPSYPTNSTATLDYPSTSTQQPPNKTETWAGYAANPPPGYGQVPVDPAEKRYVKRDRPPCTSY